MAKTVVVIEEDRSGRNIKFHDKKSDRDMSREQFVKEIKKGNFPDYHVREINGILTPVSNPDTKEGNNLD